MTFLYFLFPALSVLFIGVVIAHWRQVVKGERQDLENIQNLKKNTGYESEGQVRDFEDLTSVLIFNIGQSEANIKEKIEEQDTKINQILERISGMEKDLSSLQPRRYRPAAAITRRDSRAGRDPSTLEHKGDPGSKQSDVQEKASSPGLNWKKQEAPVSGGQLPLFFGKPTFVAWSSEMGALTIVHHESEADWGLEAQRLAQRQSTTHEDDSEDLAISRILFTSESGQNVAHKLSRFRKDEK